MKSFGALLDEYSKYGYDDPNNFPFNWERKYWGDKVIQYDFDEDVHKENIIQFPTKYEVSGSLLRKRNSCRIEKLRLKKMSYGYHYPAGSYFDEGKDRYIRLYRDQRSKEIKKDCHRKFRREFKNNTEYITTRSIAHRVTEFWWEYI